MDTKKIAILTISPIYIPLELKTGVNRLSQEYIDFKADFNHPEITFTSQNNAQKEYQSIEQDSWEHRLLVWQDDTLNPQLTINVFPNNIAIVVLKQAFDYHDDVKTLEDTVQQATNQLIEQVYPRFIQALGSLNNDNAHRFFNFNQSATSDAEVYWISRTLLLNSDDLASKQISTLITNWLNHTARPEDAEEIIKGHIDSSLTWLRYAIVDLQITNDERLESMVLAQYYYAAQERCNKLLKQAIDSAYNAPNTEKAQLQLSRSRVVTRLHQVDYHEHLKYLTRSKRKYLEDILKHWDFDRLTANGQRMIEICSSKLEETENRKREKSSVVTDLLLVALSFFTVFELSLYLTELSREMMSRPTLDFNDDSRSFMLQFIAEIDTDVMFGSGFFLTLLLVFVYKFVKSR